LVINQNNWAFRLQTFKANTTLKETNMRFYSGKNNFKKNNKKTYIALAWNIQQEIISFVEHAQAQLKYIQINSENLDPRWSFQQK
jgi:hypothetical protein